MGNGKTRQSGKLRRRPRRTSAARRAGSSTMALLLDLAEKAPIGPRKNTCDSREGERELRANALRRRGIAAGALRVARTWPFSTVSASNHLKPPTAARGSGQKSSIRAISSCYTTHKRGISGRGLGWGTHTARRQGSERRHRWLACMHLQQHKYGRSYR